MRVLSFQEPLALAIAEGATEPAANVGDEIWSTVSEKTLYWDGASWSAMPALVSGDIAQVPPLPILPPGEAAVLGGSSRFAREDHSHVFPFASLTQGGFADVETAATIITAAAHSENNCKLNIGKDSLLPQPIETDGVSDWVSSASIGGKVRPWFQPAYGNGEPDAFMLQPANYDMMVRTWGALANTTQVAAVSFDHVITGNPSSMNPTAPGTRLAIRTATTAGSSAGLRGTLPHLVLGKASGFSISTMWGFHLVMRLNPQTVLGTQHRFFFGMAPVGTVIGNVNPSTVPNIFGFCADSGDVALSTLVNGVKVATSVSAWRTAFPTTDAIDFHIGGNYNGPSDTVFFGCRRVAKHNAAHPLFWEVRRTGVAQNLPASFAPTVWWNNGTTAVADTWDLHSIYWETDG